MQHKFMIMMTGVQRSKVLSLYRQIFRLARTWTSATGRSEDTYEEKTYIKTEAQRLFRKNKNETSEDVIKEHITEAETRIGLAQHYGNPYPRMMNYPPNVLSTQGQRKLKKDRRILQQATPAYLKSYEDEWDPKNDSKIDR